MSTAARVWCVVMVCVTALVITWLSVQGTIVSASINATRCIVGGL
jgi:hypothetical protein